MAVKVEVPDLEPFADKLEKNLKEVISKGALEIEARAKAKCPVDTGNLRNSIHTEIKDDGKSAEVGTAVEYGAYVEFGTIHQPPHPFLIPSGNEVWNARIKPALHNIGG